MKVFVLKFQSLNSNYFSLSDIVFDPSVIQSLVDTIKIFLTHGGAKCAYIANTIRNVDTNKCFTSELGMCSLNVLNFFYYKKLI